MEIKELLTEKNINIVNEETTSDGVVALGVASNIILETAQTLKEHYNFLVSVSGVDTKENFIVIYHFYSTKTNKKGILKAMLDRNNPKIESISGIYATANWHERETYDLLGIEFINHPDLKRILLPKDWIGHPLRKNYVQEDPRLVWNER